MLSDIQSAFIEAENTLSRFIADDGSLEAIQQFVETVSKAISIGNKVISCGNGGSMCDAMHFAEELTGRFRDDRHALPAIAISDPSHITCTGNDYGFDSIFSRYIEGVGRHGDVLLAISTSGNSPNIINAVNAAKKMGLVTVGLLGKDGGKLRDLVDLPLVVPAQTSDRIQEVHIKIIHIVIELTEKQLFK